MQAGRTADGGGGNLLQGESVTSAALDAGYTSASTSAFVTAFRSRFGQTPGASRTGTRP